jgi:hypothetical protein
MGRLMEKDKNGEAYPIGMEAGEYYSILDDAYVKMKEAFEKLAKYEETGLEPEQIYEMDRLYREKCKELARKWIPVKKRLPTEQEVAASWKCDAGAGEFIVMIKDAVLPTHLYFHRSMWFDENFNYYEVVAWMTMPEPYKN